MKKIITFGELLLRISPALGGQWIRDTKAEVYIGGAEVNVATALARWNVPVRYCTALPDNYLSREIIAELKAKSIDTSAILISGDKIGLYYLPGGSDLKNKDVIYDRVHSSFSQLKTSQLNWDGIFEGCDWFHFSAISPAIGYDTALLCEEALKYATRSGMTISVDLNYRKKLWQYGMSPGEVMQMLLPYCHVVMGNIWSAEELLGIPCLVSDSMSSTKGQFIDAAMDSIRLLQATYPKIGTIAYTFRLENMYFAILQHQNGEVVSKEFHLRDTISRIGTGDCFMAGLIYGYHKGLDADDMVNFAASAAVMKMYEKGDATAHSVETIKSNLGTNGQ